MQGWIYHMVQWHSARSPALWGPAFGWLISFFGLHLYLVNKCCEHLETFFWSSPMYVWQENAAKIRKGMSGIPLNVNPALTKYQQECCFGINLNFKIEEYLPCNQTKTMRLLESGQKTIALIWLHSSNPEKSLFFLSFIYKTFRSCRLTVSSTNRAVLNE